VLRQPFDGIVKPEPLKENLSVFWLRRIDDTHRLVYCDEGESLVVIVCRYHYQRTLLLLDKLFVSDESGV
jgi:toxin YoeB